MRGAEAIGAGVAAADDDDVPVARADRLDLVALARAVLGRQIVHREMNARQLATGHAQVARHGRSARQHDSIEIALQLPRIAVHTDVTPGLEDDAFLAHQRQPALQPPFFELECRDAIAKQSADAIRALEDGHVVARAVQLIAGRQARRSRADDGHTLARPRCGRLRANPSFGERALDNRDLRRLDRHRRVVDPEHARSLARRGAQPPREFREIVRRVQPIDGGAPPVAIHEIVPVGNQVAERTAVVTERNPAVHAARGLILQRRWLVGKRHFPPVAHALGNRTRRRLLPLDLEEPGDLTHGRPSGRSAPAPVRRRASSSRARACSHAASPS